MSKQAALASSRSRFLTTGSIVSELGRDIGYPVSPGAKTIKKNTNSTQNKFQTHRAKQYEVTSFLSTDCELSTETCSKNVYSIGPMQASRDAKTSTCLYRLLLLRNCLLLLLLLFLWLFPSCRVAGITGDLSSPHRPVRLLARS